MLTSGQPKTDQTGAVVALRRGLQVRIEPRIREVEQPSGWLEGDYRQIAAEYLEGHNPQGWEPEEAVARRFTAAVDEAAAPGAEGDIVVVNHGLALSLYLRSTGATIAGSPFDAVPFWRALTFPDAWRLDPESLELTHLFNAGLPPE